MSYCIALRLRCLAIMMVLLCAPSIAAENIQLTLEDGDIRELVKWASDHTGKNIILHPDVKGNVTVLAGEPMSRSEAVNVFMSVLEVNGFAMLESEDSLRIVPAAVANSASSPEREYSRDGDVVVRIFRAKNMPVGQLVNIIKPLVPQEALVSAYPESNLLLISDRAHNVSRIAEIIANIDTSGTIDIEVIKLDHAAASDIQSVITQLLPGRINDRSSGAQGVKLTADTRSNSLLMSGDPMVRKQLRTLVRRLDQPEVGDGNTQVIFVNYADAESLVPTLMNISGDYQDRQRNDAGQPVTEVRINVNKDMNALVITAPPSLLSTMKSVIQQLDVRRAQVLVEALIVEVSEDVLQNVGVEWRTNVPSDGGFVGFRSVPSAISTPEIPSLGLGMTLGFFSGSELRAVIRALEADSGSNILSTPTIVALDNEKAEILVGSNVPFITGQSTGSAASTENPFQTIERHDIGISLKILPRINNDDSITLDVQQTVENIAQSTGETSDVVTNKRDVRTKVLIEDDEVLVLGGLIDDATTEVSNKVPVLGRIPGLGRLFRSDTTRVTKRNLMVFIHPRILRTEQQKGQATRAYYENFRALQDQYNRESDIYSISTDEFPHLPSGGASSQGRMIGPSLMRPLSDSDR